MSKQAIEALTRIVLAELLRCGCLEENIRVEFGETLVEEDGQLSVTLQIQFTAYDTDDGRISPPPVLIQFDCDEAGNWRFIVGEDTEMEITYGNLFACIYFYSMQALAAPAGKEEGDATKQA